LLGRDPDATAGQNVHSAPIRRGYLEFFWGVLSVAGVLSKAAYRDL
jgi:hypothetical protein